MPVSKEPQNYVPDSRLDFKSCRICHGISKSRCMFCGQRLTLRKQDMTPLEIVQLDAWKEKIEYLRATYKKLLALKMRTTGCPELDKKVLDHIGDWRQLI